MKLLWKRLLGIFLIAVLLTGSVSANSAQTWWEGVDGSGVIVADETSPIVVEKELLTFDLQEFPKEDYDASEDISQYQGAVTAEYTFYNPSEYTVTAKLLFPFGIQPSYAGSLGSMEDCYGVYVDGEAVPCNLRHSLTNGYDQFSLDKDLGKLSDDYVEGAWVRQDTPVRKYTFQVEGTDAQQGSSVTAAFAVDGKEKDCWIYSPDICSYSGYDDGTEEASVWAWDGKTIAIYVIGQWDDSFPEWKFHADGNMAEETDGKMTEVSVEELTFRDFALSQWREGSGVSEMDWYNAMVTACEEMASENGIMLSFWRYGMDLTRYLMGWYEYEITLEPGQHITNAVTAPMYPDIDQSYEPAVYTYHYLLSPAQTWSQFGKLEIQINTPYHMSDESISGFQQTETGYRLVQGGLPEGELTFSLCQEEEPEMVKSSGLSALGPGIVMVGFCVLLLCGLVAVLVGLRKKKR